MKILMVCTCGRKISLEKCKGTFTPPGTFRATCRRCGTRHTLKIEMQEHSTEKTRTHHHQEPEPDLDAWFARAALNGTQPLTYRAD